MEENKKMSEEQAIKELEKGYQKAEELLNETEKLENFLQKLEKKLKIIPKVGNTLAMVPTMISLIRKYVKKEYTEIPLGTIIAVISALIYVFTPIDFVPDAIPGAGYIDDALVISACLKLISSDIEDYQKWRKENNKDLDESN